MGTIAIIFLAYLIGSLSFAVLVSRAFGLPDPRSYGSGNPGATNVMRSGKKAAAVLTLLGDGAKGWCAVFLAQQLASSWDFTDWGIAASALAVFVGHLFPVFFGFKGGKGVATAAGILFALNLWLGLAVLATWLLTFVLSRYSSLAALLASALAPVYAMFLLNERYIGAVIVLSGLLIWRHRANIQKLLQGTESSFKKTQE